MAYDGKEKRADDPWRAEVRRQIEDINTRLDENMRVTHESKAIIVEVKASTDEIVEFFQAGKGFFMVVRAVGSVARWVAIIAAAFGIAYGLVRFGIGQILADMGIGKK